MRAHGQTKLGFYPLPIAEAGRLKKYLAFAEPFSALDPCVGDGIAFRELLQNAPARRYGIEIDAYRAEQAKALENRNPAGEHDGGALSGGIGLLALPESSLRLGSWLYK